MNKTIGRALAVLEAFKCECVFINYLGVKLQLTTCKRCKALASVKD